MSLPAQPPLRNPENRPLACLALPSWTRPGGIAENARFLSGKAAEVGLCFFESEACLAYGREDLPWELADLPLSWHVHLPLDLPWREGRAGTVALRLMAKVAFLGATRAVLHLPQGRTDRERRKALAGLVVRWRDAGRRAPDLLLENQVGDNPDALLALAREQGCGLCLDVAHWLLTSGAAELPDPEYLNLVGLMHLNAPGENRSGHAALPELTPDQALWCRALLQNYPALHAQRQGGAAAPALLMLELFTWENIQASLPLLREWLGQGQNCL